MLSFLSLLRPSALVFVDVVVDFVVLVIVVPAGGNCRSSFEEEEGTRVDHESYRIFGAKKTRTFVKSQDT